MNIEEDFEDLTLLLDSSAEKETYRQHEPLQLPQWRDQPIRPLGKIVSLVEAPQARAAQTKCVDIEEVKVEEVRVTHAAVHTVPSFLSSFDNESSLDEPSGANKRYERNMKALERPSMRQQAAKNGFKDHSSPKNRTSTDSIVANLRAKITSWELESQQLEVGSKERRALRNKISVYMARLSKTLAKGSSQSLI